MSRVCHGRKRKRFFFEKKKQKTFALWDLARLVPAPAVSRSFFASFFSKKEALTFLMFVTRFAPSPTGHLHLGHAFSASLAHSRARAAGGQFLLRLEDIDQTRCRPEFAAGILADLEWLGLFWDGEPRVQSEHLPDYAAALERLANCGLLYPCFCSRAEIQRAQAAPHAAAPVYPGTCRSLSPAAQRARIESGAPYALRLNLALALPTAGDLRFFEESSGWVTAVPQLLGDVVLARRDVPTSYHLCVTHDDALQGVTHVIRGQDLAESTHIHVLLQRLLDLPTPIYAHHRLLTDASGKRLAKRDFAATLRSMREAGETAASVLIKLSELAAA
jgi:glutamyl-Q tRNA(Asp) synthetase